LHRRILRQRGEKCPIRFGKNPLRTHGNLHRIEVEKAISSFPEFLRMEI
jgi:hypothetical protein